MDQDAPNFPARFCNNKYEASGEANSLLGSGGFAYVWRGKRLEDNLPVAVKIMRLQAMPPRLQLQMESEIAVMKQLNHENILHLYDTDKTSSGNLVLILEYCDKKDLQKFINAHKTPGGLPHLSVSDTVYFFRQLAAGYGVLRKKDILHRDIKPENLLLTTREGCDGTRAEDLLLKIADFGLAREVGQDLALTECGTKAFAAPEIALGAGYTYKADMWAIGCTLHLCLTGMIYNPHLGFSEEATNLPGEAFNLLEGLLQADPDNRVTYEELVYHQFLNPPRDAALLSEESRKKSGKTLATNSKRRSSSARPTGLSPRKHYTVSDSVSPTSPDTPVRKKSYYKGPLAPSRDQVFFTQAMHDARWACTLTVSRVVKSLEDQRAPETTFADLFVLYVVVLEACVALKKVLTVLADYEMFGATMSDVKARIDNIQARKDFDQFATVTPPQDILITEAINKCRIAYELESDKSDSVRTKLELAKTNYSEAKACLSFVISFLLNSETYETNKPDQQIGTPTAVLNNMVNNISQRIDALTTKLG